MMIGTNFNCNINEQPFIIVKKNIVVKVSQELIELIEYQPEEILNKNIKDLFNILRVGSNFNIENINKKVNYFLFTKSFDVKFINIEVIKELDEQIYVFREKLNSKFEEKFNYLYTVLSENLSGIAILYGFRWNNA
jgi:adenylate kinase